SRSLKIGEVLGVLPEQVELLDRGRMHGGHVEKSDILVHARLSVDIASLTRGLTSISRLPHVERVAREHLGEVGVLELLLRLSIVSKYDLRGMLLGRGVDWKSREVCQDLSRNEVPLQMLERLIGGLNVVRTVVGDLSDLVFRDRLVPGELHLLVFEPELQLPLLQRLLDRSVIEDVSEGDVVCLTEICVRHVVDDLLAELVEALV